MSARGHEPAERKAVAAVRRRLGARRLRARCTRCSPTTRARARASSALERTYRAGAPTTLTLAARRAAGTRPRRRRRRPGHAARRASSARCAARSSLPIGRARGRRPGRRLARRARLPRPAPRREAQARDDAAAARGDPGPRRHRRSPRARTACPTSDRWPPRSPAASAPRRPSAPPSSQRAACPTGAPVGLTGLEREFDERLAGTPGGIAATPASRVLAARAARARRRRAHHDRPEASSAPRSRRSPAATAGSPSCGPRTGEVLALAGHRLLGAPAARARRSRSSRSPARWRPASRQARRDASRSRPRPTLEGVELQNANGESCGGSLRSSFAHSCNSRLRAAGREARRARSSSRPPRAFGFNQDPALAGAARSTIPAARRDRRRPRGRLVGDRPGQGARHAAARWRSWRRRSAPRGVAPAPDAAQGRRPGKATRATSAARRAHDQELHAHAS